MIKCFMHISLGFEYLFKKKEDYTTFLFLASHISLILLKSTIFVLVEGDVGGVNAAKMAYLDLIFCEG